MEEFVQISLARYEQMKAAAEGNTPAITLTNEFLFVLNEKMMGLGTILMTKQEYAVAITSALHTVKGAMEIVDNAIIIKSDPTL